jgi:RHS repeat-associated protein
VLAEAMRARLRAAPLRTLGFGLGLGLLASPGTSQTTELPTGNPATPEVVRFYHADTLGSVRAVTDLQGDVVARYDYLPYGEQIPAAQGRGDVPGYDDDAGNKHKFTAKERDSESSLDYFGARYFSGAQGRFTSADPDGEGSHVADPQSWNAYAYSLDNPLRYVDPDGESATLAGAIGGAIVGGGIALWKGESVWQGAVSGAVAGALAGAVIDTGGAALGVYGAAAAGGALGGAGGGVVGRALKGEQSTVRDVAVDATLGAAGGVVGAAAGKAVTYAAQRVVGPSARFETLRPGPYANESIPASGPRVTAAEAQQLRGQPCHTCGRAVPGTKSGNPVGDHQPATGSIVRGSEQNLYPQCTNCSFPRQANQVRAQNGIWRQQQRIGEQAGAGAGTAGTRRREDEPY